MTDFNITPSLIPSDTYSRENDFELASLFLESDSGGRLDLKPIYENMSFVEDIDNNAIIGSIVLKDGLGIINKFPITCNETLTISFRTPGIGSDFVTAKFIIVEVTDRVRSTNERVEVYRLKFVSPSAIINKSTKISKAYAGTVSEIAESVYDDAFGTSMDIVQPTRGQHKFVMSRWSPFKCLEWLAHRAIPAKRSDETNYLFFETVDGHRFVTLSGLCSQDNKIGYFQMPAALRSESTQDYGRMFLNIKDIAFLKTYQKFEEHINGGFSSVLYQHDVTTKSWSKRVYNYNRDTDVRYLTDTKITSNNDLYTQTPDVNINLTTKQTGLMGKDYPDVQNHEDWLQRTMSSNALMDTMKIRIQTSGNSLLRVGDVIELYVPTTAPLKATDTEWYDERVSGRFLVTTLRHTITKQGYTTTMILSKNSYELPVPDVSKFLGTDSKQQQQSIVRRRG